MKALLRDRITVVWGALIVLTLFSWELGTDHGISDAKLASAIVLVVAFVKLRFVGRSFMELRDAPIPLLAIFEGWVVVVGTAVVVMFVAGS